MQSTRLIWITALLAGLSYLWPVIAGIDGMTSVIWKGSGVALLALWCAAQAKTFDGWLIALVMALGAAGDVLLETHGVMQGALAFAAGHVVAIFLYWRNGRRELTRSQSLLAVFLPLLSVTIAWQLAHDAAVAFYTAILGSMVAFAWLSRFPRYRTGLGAVLFMVSDLLIFARMGVLADAIWIGPAIWLLYFGGQVMIAEGVTSTLSTRLINTPRRRFSD
jgi:uncharacterized membrane protein YhhN